MRRISRFVVVAIVVGASAFGRLAFAAPDVEPDRAAILDYIAAVNGGDIASVRRLRNQDVSAEFAQAMPEEDLVQFFRNQKRANGGLDFVDAHAGGRRAEHH